MPEEATAVELRPHIRLLHGMRRPANWLQLVRFGIVGGVGFVVNLAVYTLFVHARRRRLPRRRGRRLARRGAEQLRAQPPLDVRRARGPAHFQAMRFLAREPRRLGLQPAAADAARRGRGPAKVPAQALAVAASMPLNFLGNKLWSFRVGAPETARRAARRARVRGPLAGAQAGTYTLTFPLPEDLSCRRWSSTASASTWLASSRSCS